MSLRDLKKSTPSNSDSGSAIDIDSFINGAQSYAYGLEKEDDIHSNGDKTKNATFSLTPQSTKELAGISKRTGICKSRLLRLLVHDQYYSDDQWLFSQSVK